MRAMRTEAKTTADSGWLHSIDGFPAATDGHDTLPRHWNNTDNLVPLGSVLLLRSNSGAYRVCPNSACCTPKSDGVPVLHPTASEDGLLLTAHAVWQSHMFINMRRLDGVCPCWSVGQVL